MATRDWDEFLETHGYGEYAPLTGAGAEVPQGTATGAHRGRTARFGGWRGVLAVCAVLACLGGIFFGRDLQARGGGEAQVAGEDPEGARAFDQQPMTVDRRSSEQKAIDAAWEMAEYKRTGMTVERLAKMTGALR